MIIPYSTLMALTVFSFTIREKTRFSFTSSNSSFTDSMITYNTFRFSNSQNNDNSPLCSVNDLGTHNTICNISKHNTLDNYNVCKFEFCSFIDVSSGTTNGGAIAYFRTQTTASGTSLSITTCFFFSCTAITANPATSGGGVAVMYVSTVTISSCLFKLCDGAGSGGVFLQHITQQPSISDCTFYSCRCTQTGAGAYVGYSTLAVSPIFCTTCSFLSCKELHNSGDTLSGGGFSLCSSAADKSNTIINSLFTHNHAKMGAGLKLYMQSGITPAVKFCFFNQNTATQSGHDICLSQLQENPLFYCFTSNPQSNRIYVYPAYKNTPTSSPTNYPNWLP